MGGNEVDCSPVPIRSSEMDQLDVDDVEIPFDQRLSVLPSSLCRHLRRHSLSSWHIGNSRPFSQIYPRLTTRAQRPRFKVDPCGPGQRGLWVTGPPDALPRRPKIRQGAQT